MKKILKFLSCMLAVALVFTACSKEGATASGENSPVKDGVYVDKVIYMVSMDQSVALKDVVEGKADVLFTKASPALIKGLSDVDRDKIDIYPVPSGYWSLYFNPIPNKPPYSWTSEAGEEIFNPFAIKEVRYAFNWLIDRKKITDELLLGEGGPMFTPCIPGIPGTYRYNLLPSEYGITDTGDEKKALDMIKEAMEKAAALPELKGLLEFKDEKWMYKGKPVKVKSVMRVDEPQGRLPCARYIHSQLEKAGIGIEAIERDRKTAGALVYGSNPADLEWTLYLEGWGAGGTDKYHYVSLAQMYAPFYGYMPGGAEAGYWNYENAALDELGKKAAYGQYLTADEYWEQTVNMCALGIEEAVRVYVVFENDLYVANKERLNSRLLYGLGDGFNGWTIRGADVKKDTDGPYEGLRVLRVMQFSSQGSLFMSEWDPIGGQGFSDTYSAAIINALTDDALMDNPCTASRENALSTVDVASGKFAPKLVPTGNKTFDGEDEYEMGGDIPVPADAVIYDTAQKKWVPADSSATVSSCATGKLTDGYYWHNGEAVDMMDVRYAIAFLREWATKDGEDDPYYDSPLDAVLTPDLKTSKGHVFHADGSVTSYQNYYFAPDLPETALTVGGVSVKAANPGRRTSFPWEIYEACSEMVVKGAKSGTAYNFAKDGGGRGVEVSVIAAECVADIKAKLQEFIDEKHIPVSLKDLIKEDYAVKRYKASLDFIEKYGHAYISTGPIMIEKIDTITTSIICSAVKKYPYKSDYFPNLFRNDMTIINYVKAPASVSADKDANYEVTVAKYTYPDVARTPLQKGEVVGKLQLGSEEKVYKATENGGGKYTVTIPAADLAKLEKGADYTLVIFSSIADEPPATRAVSVSILK